MSYFAIEKWALSKKFFALEEIAEKVAPDLLEDIHTYRDKPGKTKQNDSMTKISIDLNENLTDRAFIDIDENDEYIRNWINEVKYLALETPT